MKIPAFEDPSGGSIDLTVPQSLCGPPDCANGGLVSGLLARSMPGTVEVTLRRPVPLDEPVIMERIGPAKLIRRGHEVLALAQPADPLPDPPPAPSWAEALEATACRPPAECHPFPTCFVCGPARMGTDSLGIRPGPIRGGRAVAAPWIPDPILGEDDLLPRELVWAALDCPGGFAAILGQRPRPVVLGRISAQLRADVPVGRPLIVQGWRVAVEGRKHVVGTAIHTLDGDCLAVARAVWFEV